MNILQSSSASLKFISRIQSMYFYFLWNSASLPCLSFLNRRVAFGWPSPREGSLLSQIGGGHGDALDAPGGE